MDYGQLDLREMFRQMVVSCTWIIVFAEACQVVEKWGERIFVASLSLLPSYFECTESYTPNFCIW
jgi:hypothetical protein